MFDPIWFERLYVEKIYSVHCRTLVVVLLKVLKDGQQIGNKTNWGGIAAMLFREYKSPEIKL
jgi:hypothetical protein